MSESEQPHNIEAEQALLGALLCNNDTLHRVSDLVTDDSFFDPVHADIFKVASARIRRDHVADAVTLKNELGDHPGLQELGGGKYLIKLAGASISVFACRDYALIIADLKDKRDLLGHLEEAKTKILEGEQDVAAISGGLEAHLIEPRAGGRKTLVSFQEAVLKAAEQAGQAHQAEGVAGATTGLAGLDKKTGGLFAGDFIVIGGRPSMGKTALALSIALGSARSGNGVAIASLEMTASSLALRAISEATAQEGSGVAYTDIRKGIATDHQVETFIRSAQDVQNLPIQIIPPEMRDIGAIYSGTKRAAKILEARGTPLKMLIVDYLQLIRSPKQSRIDQISEISMALKGLAMQLEIPVVALSQLSRSVEYRDEKRPIMSDLRESGQIEQDADAIMFCYRDEYYLERERPNFKKNNGDHDYDAEADFESSLTASRNKMEVILAKQRMGEIGTVNLRFNPQFNLIWEDVA